MDERVHKITSAEQISEIAGRLREVVRTEPISPACTLQLLNQWGTALRGTSADQVPGAPFLELWLRRGTLEPLLARELGRAFLEDVWQADGAAALKWFPRGLVGHWPAGNIDLQPVLSMSCGLLGGNACLVRVPESLLAATRQLAAPLWTAEALAPLARRVAMISFDHSREDLQTAMARGVDGAMIWGGAEAIRQIRALPFPPWTRIVTFGPRLSVAAMDEPAWTNAATRSTWCRRIARDVWAFDQQACTSPQTLFLEHHGSAEPAAFIAELRQSFADENRLHRREAIEPALTSAICLARANWLLADVSQDALFPLPPDWTILVGTGSEIPVPTQGRTLSVLLANDLREVIGRFDGNVQTLGLAMSDEQKEHEFADLAARHGVDRIVKLGRMHVFGSPWDGVDLVRPMMRLVRHAPSQD